jgi:hypothetical protein
VYFPGPDRDARVSVDDEAFTIGTPRVPKKVDG